MSEDSADRNLLFGVLAVQLDFVSRDDLIAATSRWVLDKQQPLSEVFVKQGMMSAEESRLVDGIVQKQLQRHGDDPRQSLQQIEGCQAICATLRDVADADVRKTVEFSTIGNAPAQTPGDPYTTQPTASQDSPDSKHRFSILRLHQKGGLGRVSIALDEELHREIALKEILPAHADNEENRTRFVREAEITGALEHPGVVPVYSLGQFADGRPYYAMRFIHGINMQVATDDYHQQEGDPAEKQLKFRQLLTRFIDVCYAIEYAHSRAVIHRDLKPGNIMLGDYGETLVVDWGLAKSLEDGFQTDASLTGPVHTSTGALSTKTQIGRVVGTPSYMSPEQAAGRLDALGPCSDIYSLGATLYHVITGKTAFQGREDEVLGNVQMGRFKRPRAVNPRVPRALEAICLKAMSRMPKDRYASGRELAEDVERFLADERVLAYDEPLPAQAWRWIRNHKPLVISSAAALTVAVAALSISVVKLQASNIRERQLRAEATANFEKAERNFGLARDAVQQYFVTVSEEKLLAQPGMQALRESLLRQALVYYKTFLQERQDDPGLREEVAQAFFYVAQITQLVDSPAESLQYYQRAAQLQDQLLAGDPKNKDLMTRYGTTLNAHGGALGAVGKFDQALEKFEQAEGVREVMAEADPDDVESARTLANSKMNVGGVYLRTGRLEEAIERFNQAQGIRMAHIDDVETSDVKLQRDLAKGHYLTGLASQRLGDLTNSEKSFSTAVDVFQRVLDADPNNMDNQRNLAACHRMVGDLKSDAGLAGEAIASYQQAAAILEELRIRNPKVLQYTYDLARLYRKLSLQFDSTEPSALKPIDDAVALLEELTKQAPKVPGYRIQLGIALREAGILLVENGQPDAARERLEQSKAVFSALVKQELSNPVYTTELRKTEDDLARLAAQAAEGAAASEQQNEVAE